MTEREKQALYVITEDPEQFYTYRSDMIGDGLSIWINDQWIGGLFFKAGTNEVAGGVIPRLQKTGIWIRVWPGLATWAHAVANGDFVMNCKEEKTADLMIRLGAVDHKTWLPETRQYQVRFVKEQTEEFLKEKYYEIN